MISIIMRRPAKKTIQNLIAVAFWLFVWQLASVSVGSSLLLVSPLRVLDTLGGLAMSAAFWRTILFSAWRIIGGFLLALGVGALLAMGGARFVFLDVLLRPLMLTVKSVPVASFIILALMWLRNTANLAVLISFLMVLPIVYTGTLAGIRSADKKLLQMAQVFRVPPMRRMRYLVLPAVLPHFKSACSVGLGLCWKSGVAAEVIGITTGSIGAALYNAKIFFSTAELFAWTLVIVLVSLVFEKMFLWALHKAETALVEGNGL